VIRWRSSHELPFTEYLTQEETFTHFGIRLATKEEKEELKRNREYRKKLRAYHQEHGYWPTTEVAKSLK